MSDELVITVAASREVTREQQPTSLLPDEAARSTAGVRRRRHAGTSTAAAGRDPTQDLETFRLSPGVRPTSILQQFSTGGAVGMGVEERIEALGLEPRWKP